MAAAPERVRHSRILSFSSNKSERSSNSHGSKPKTHLIETHQEKEANRMHTHADPTRAINEAQPSVIALEKSTMESLRAMQHKDRFGNIISDPDLSNPTRHRFERPLETIRAFEAAVDGTYNSRRMSYIRDPRGNLNYPARGYSDQNGIYNNRGFQSRPDTLADAYGGSGYNSQYNSYHEMQAPRVPRHGGRSQRDSWGQPPNGFTQNGQYQPYDSGSASGSGNQSMDQLAQSTDPSSLNSSRDGFQQQQQQLQQQQQQRVERQIGEAYGFTGFGTDPQLEYSQPPFQSLPNESYGANGSNGSNGALQGDPYASQALSPPPPAKDSKPSIIDTVRKNSIMQKAKGSTEKRKSWFKRLSKT
ncbi:hypothetical protein PRK78_005449 [Emydomyces testavorans]|uniref:Uncharacterized protein n=1 Tax=Emydomyces testavorans TaxID=2070801 RepID=A0AAF0IKM6_9EURO|nr:hypothetical protein PRK78_005449 [Emydomyces testavorans]